ncbi:MAG: flippase-like domain-containing protein, partial [Planctomycetota bacterium]
WMIVAVGLFVAVIAWTEMTRPAGQPSSWTLLAQADRWLVLAALATLWASQLPLMVIWLYLCRRAGLQGRRLDLLRTFSAMLLFGVLTPGRSGELAVPLMDRDNFGRLASVVVVNRVLGLIFTICLAIFVLMLVVGGVFATGQGLLVLGLVVVFATVLSMVLYRPAVTWAVRLVFRLIGPLRRLPGFRTAFALRPTVERGIDVFFDAVHNIIHWRGVAFIVLMLIAAHALALAATWLVVRAVGQQYPFPLLVGAMATNSVAGFLLPLPGGMGGGEVLTKALFEQYGRTPAGAFLILIRVMIFLVPMIYFLGVRLRGLLVGPAGREVD